MRLLLPVLVLLSLSVAIFLGGQVVSPHSADDGGAVVEAVPDPEVVASTPAAAARPTASSRLVAPAIVAPPGVERERLERAAPRKPLSELSLALPPKPKPVGPVEGGIHFRPVATGSAIFESMGRTVTIAGVESVPVEEECVSGDVRWACGMRARTAFRLWLRGRALACDVPPETRDAAVVAPCRLGTVDAGSWLVGNGWARARADGPYLAEEAAARSGKKGIFGPAPDLSGLSGAPEQ